MIALLKNGKNFILHLQYFKSLHFPSQSLSDFFSTLGYVCLDVLWNFDACGKNLLVLISWFLVSFFPTGFHDSHSLLTLFALPVSFSLFFSFIISFLFLVKRYTTMIQEFTLIIFFSAAHLKLVWAGHPSQISSWMPFNMLLSSQNESSFLSSEITLSLSLFVVSPSSSCFCSDLQLPNIL